MRLFKWDVSANGHYISLYAIVNEKMMIIRSTMGRLSILFSDIFRPYVLIMLKPFVGFRSSKISKSSSTGNQRSWEIPELNGGW